jgi:DnaJ like chaperone protein
VNRQSSDAEIKKRYRELVQAYHPDKISSKGLPDEFVQLAHEKFREIQSAYEEIKKERGIA